MRIGISGQRYYDADTARFITEDSYLGDQSEPPSLHRYLYAYSNPLVYVDLEGNASIREMLGLDEKSVDAAAANDGSWWGAAKFAAKATGYTLWNGVTGGFLARQDARQEKVDRGQISESDFWKGTGIDATASVATQVVAGGVLGKAATAGGLVRTMATGAAVSGGTSLVEQTAQVVTYEATDGRLGQEKIDAGQALESAASGALVAGGLYGAGKIVQQVKSAKGSALDTRQIGIILFPNRKGRWTDGSTVAAGIRKVSVHFTRWRRKPSSQEVNRMDYSQALSVFNNGLAFLLNLGFVGPDVQVETSKLAGDSLLMIYSSLHADRKLKISYFPARKGDFASIVVLVVGNGESISFHDWLEVNGIKSCISLSTRTEPSLSEDVFIENFCRDFSKICHKELFDILSGKSWQEIPFNWKGYR